MSEDANREVIKALRQVMELPSYILRLTLHLEPNCPPEVVCVFIPEMGKGGVGLDQTSTTKHYVLVEKEILVQA